ncbi:MAG: polysaccharide deacetylase family protein [Candidatus Eisenbacteria bacterium]|nr:polysaccharide deacetylase family protein [Candidatus Eisenbacteria bacterium]
MKNFLFWVILVIAVFLSLFASGRIARDLPIDVRYILVPAAVLAATIAARIFMLNLTPQAVPVLYYHSINDECLNPAWAHLSCPVRTFETQMAYLKRRGFRAITLDQLHDHILGRKILEEKSVVITFDDGFLDNWVYAFPILKRLGLKGTVFLSTDFIDPKAGVRPTARHGEGRGSTRIESKGYLSWQEIETMAKSGVFDFQSHASSHTWLFSSDRIVDFHHPNDCYFWLDWNYFPEHKPYWLTSYPVTPAPFGTPVFSHGKALEVTRFIENPSFSAEIVSFVERNGGTAFFSKPGWKEDLTKHSQEIAVSVPPGRLETESERNERLRGELAGSRQIISSKLNASVNFLAWPGGGKNENSIRIALNDAGYLATAGKGERNIPFGKASTFTRISGGPMYTGKKSLIWDFLGFVAVVEVFRGNCFFYPLLFLVNRVGFLRRLAVKLQKKAASRTGSYE